MEQLINDGIQEGVTHRAVWAHEPRLTSLRVGPAGVEISLAPHTLPAVLQEANAHLRADRRDRARACLDSPAMQGMLQDLACDTSRTDLMYVAAKLFLETDRLPEAIEWLRRIVAVEAHPLVLSELADAVEKAAGYRSASLPYLRWAYELDSGHLANREAYALCLRDVGQVSASVELFEGAPCQTEERYSLLQHHLWTTHYLPGTRRADQFALARQWAALDPNRQAIASRHANDPSPSRKLTIGLLSGDFKCNAPLSNFHEALSCLDRDAFNLVAFSNVDHEDPGTADYRKLFDRYEDIRGLTGYCVADRVRARGVDILVAFGGQCQNNRLDVMVCKPAPIQVDWGGLCSLGLSQIDYRITDDVLDPPETQAYYRERLGYIPGGSICYQPPKSSPPVRPLTTRKKGDVTLGAFANHLKMNDETVALWSRVLRRTPAARMLLKTPCAHDPLVRRILLDRFSANDIDLGRIEIVGPGSHYEHLEQLSRVDLLLDSFPFNSFRTTLEGLWMGVPTVTLAGETFVSRMGLAIMTQLSLPDFVADTPYGFVERACAFTAQRDELAELRRGLRPYLLGSSVCDPHHFARGLADLLRTFWRNWCQTQGVRS